MGTVRIKRGDIFLVNFEPSLGNETKKMRPAVIIQNDIGNEYSQITIVAPITSKNLERIYPYEVLISSSQSKLSADSKILCNQIRSVDKLRLGIKQGELDSLSLEKVDNALRISLAL